MTMVSTSWGLSTLRVVLPEVKGPWARTVPPPALLMSVARTSTCPPSLVPCKSISETLARLLSLISISIGWLSSWLLLLWENQGRLVSPSARYCWLLAACELGLLTTFTPAISGLAAAGWGAGCCPPPPPFSWALAEGTVSAAARSLSAKGMPIVWYTM